MARLAGTINTTGVNPYGLIVTIPSNVLRYRLVSVDLWTATTIYTSTNSDSMIRHIFAISDSSVGVQATKTFLAASWYGTGPYELNNVQFDDWDYVCDTSNRLANAPRRVTAHIRKEPYLDITVNANEIRPVFYFTSEGGSNTFHDFLYIINYYPIVIAPGPLGPDLTLRRLILRGEDNENDLMQINLSMTDDEEEKKDVVALPVILPPQIRVRRETEDTSYLLSMDAIPNLLGVAEPEDDTNRDTGYEAGTSSNVVT